MWREDSNADGGYALTYSSSRRPSGDEVGELLAGPEEEGGAAFNLGAFIKNFQAM